MNNWRLLLFACLAVFQPIASFTERNLVDGRQQCCERDTRFPLRDTKQSLYGTHHFIRPIVEDRLLNIRDDINREVRQDSSTVNRLYANRQIDNRDSEFSQNFPQNVARLSRSGFRNSRNTDVRHEERILSRDRENYIRDTRRIQTRDAARDERRREITPERFSRDIRQNDRDNQERIRLFRDEGRFERNFNKARLPRDFIVSQREIRETRDQFGVLRRNQDISEMRNILKGESDDVARREIFRTPMERHDVREIALERNAPSSESRYQIDNNRDRHSLNRRGRDRVNEYKRVSLIDSRERHISEKSPVSQDEVRASNNDGRSRVASRRASVDTIDGRRHLPDENRVFRDRTMAIRRVSRESTLMDHRFTRGTNDHSTTIERNIRPERAAENRKEVRNDRGESLERREVKRISEMRQDTSRRFMNKEYARSRDLLMEQRNQRSVDRLSFRDLKDNTRSQSETRRDESRTIMDRSERSRTIEKSSRIVRGNENRKETRQNRRNPLERKELRVSETHRDESRRMSKVGGNERDSLERREVRKISEISRDESRRIREFRDRRDSLERREVRRDSDTRRDESRMMDRENGRNREIPTERRNQRSTDRLNIRDSRLDFRSRSTDVAQGRNNDRREVESRLSRRLHVDSDRNREVFAYVADKSPRTEEKSSAFNWQYLLYTLQGIYLCSITMQLISENGDNKKKSRALGWWPSLRRVIKVD